MRLYWVDGFEVRVRIENGSVVVDANREGMLSLANHLAELAKAPPGSHIHLDEHNSLGDGSAELILVRTE